MITLYGMSSPNVRKIVIALEEMGVAYTVRHVAVFRGRQFDAAFLALNPMAKVPVLVDGDGPAKSEPIFESGAILIYLAETYGAAFLPASGPTRYAVLKWLFMQAANDGPALGNNSHFRRIADENAYAAGRFRRMAAQVYRALDTRLAGTEFLGGSDYSIADMATYPWARYFHRHGMKDADCPRLVEWMHRVGARTAVLRSDEVMAGMGRRDTADMALATAGERDRFLGLHIAAPSAEDAAAGRTTADRGTRC